MFAIRQWRGEKQFYRALIRIERNVTTSTEEFGQMAAEWLANDIRSSWSLTSPSSPGDPPAKVTWNLDSSVQTNFQGRDLSGRFTGKDQRVLWFVSVDTTEGIQPGNRGGYAQALEMGTDRMRARPFMMPAIERLSATFGVMAKRTIHT